MQKRDRIWKHLGIAFAAALGLYLIGFSWVEHRRTRLGPWEVTFLKEKGSAPLIRINQPSLQITNVQIEFITASEVPQTNDAVAFVAGRAVPFPVPFGQCVFIDPLFLPGTVTLDVFEHRIQMLPRSLTIDGRTHEWVPDLRVKVGTSD